MAKHGVQFKQSTPGNGWSFQLLACCVAFDVGVCCKKHVKNASGVCCVPCRSLAKHAPCTSGTPTIFCHKSIIYVTYVISNKIYWRAIPIAAAMLVRGQVQLPSSGQLVSCKFLLSEWSRHQVKTCCSMLDIQKLFEQLRARM